MTPAIAIRGVAKRFADGTDTVRDLSIEIAAGEFLALIGPSGCGKSTLLRMIAGLDVPTAGAIDVDRSRIAYVFQDANLLPWRSVLGNVALPLELAGDGSRRDRVARAGDALRRVGLHGVDRKYPASLSGGMRMRVSLARALVARPTLLLLDEPFAALDEISRHALDAMLRGLWCETNMTVVFVTHSIAEATFLAGRAIVFSPRPAAIVADERIDLPPTRDDTVRTSTAFATIQRRLFDALHRAEVPR